MTSFNLLNQEEAIVQFKSVFALMLLLLAFTGCTAQNALRVVNRDLIIRNLILYEAYHEYCGWPSIARAANGDLLVTFTRTDEHLYPNGAAVLIRSEDNGTTWRLPQTIFDTSIDERQSGLTTLRDGRTMAHFWSSHFTKQFYLSLPDTSLTPEERARFIQFVEQPEYKSASPLQGSRLCISADAGRTWSEPMPGPESTHGGIQLADGSLLVASYRGHGGHVSVHKTPAPEQPWQQVATIYCPEPDSFRFAEPHILQLPSNRIIMMIRFTNIVYNDQNPRYHLWETYSDDNGMSWATPFETPLWGYPPHLTLLSDGRVLCTYGHRRPPYGQRACLSKDGVTWNLADEIVIRDDAPNRDLGYPVSIELEPGIVLTVFYQVNLPYGHQPIDPPDPKRKKPGIFGTIWRVPENLSPK
jgi:hypothetical protein